MWLVRCKFFWKLNKADLIRKQVQITRFMVTTWKPEISCTSRLRHVSKSCAVTHIEADISDYLRTQALVFYQSASIQRRKRNNLRWWLRSPNEERPKQTKRDAYPQHRLQPKSSHNHRCRRESPTPRLIKMPGPSSAPGAPSCHSFQGSSCSCSCSGFCFRRMAAWRSGPWAPEKPLRWLIETMPMRPR